MRPARFLLPLLLLATPVAARANTPFATPPAGGEPGQLCRAAIAAAERDAGLPPRLLAAMARVETGRRDPETGDRTDPAGAHREVLWAEGLELVRQRAALVVRLLPLSAPESEYVGQLPLF